MVAAEEGDSMLRAPLRLGIRDRQGCGDEKWKDLSGVGGIARGPGEADFGAGQEGPGVKTMVEGAWLAQRKDLEEG